MNHPVFSRHSLAQLRTCEDDLVMLCEETIRVGMDFRVIWGHRPKEVQNAAFNRGFSKKRWPNSLHNRYPSLAIDVAPWPIDWEDLVRFHALVALFRATAFFLELPIRVGLDWDGDFDFQDQSFVDYGHIELALPGRETG